MDAEALLDRLDAAQRHAVTSPAGLLAVIAGAGSGKTTVLSRRIAYRIASGAADTRHVLALTFTRQAAVELRSRLRRVGLRDDVHAGTFHAIALAVMRQRWADTGRPAPTIVGDRRRLITDVLGEQAGGLAGAPRARGDAAEIAAEIDWARARLIGPGDYAVQARRQGRRARSGPDRVAEVYAAVEVHKRRRGVADLDDLLTAVLDAVARDPTFGDALRWRFRHLFVDEAQDLNPLQAAVLKVLRGDRDDLTLVGDPNQAIYGFNGADPELLRDVASRFPGIEVVHLGTNYRCTPQIVAAGASVLTTASGDDSLAAGLVSGRLDGPTVVARRYDDAAAEALAVAEQVHRWGPRWEQIAVLARTNAQLQPIATALEERGVPTSSSRVDLRRALSEATGQRDTARLASWARDVLQPGLDDLGEPAPRNEAFVSVALAVEEYLDDDRAGDGRGFGDWVRANRPFDAARRDTVELLSFHAAKGREWSKVVVTGAETGLVPHTASTAGERRAEEARLLYVALTRGADEVLVTGAATRGGRATKPSPFLAGLPAPERAVPPPRRLRRPTPPPPDPVLERLDHWRTGVARAAGVSPHVVCPDALLVAIAAAKPATPDQLEGVPGMSVLMARRFGPRILDAVAGG